MTKDFTVIQNLHDLSPKFGGPIRAVSSLSRYLIKEGVNIKIIAQKNKEISYFKNIPIENYFFYESKRKFINLLIEKELIKVLNNLDVNLSKTVIHDNGIWLPLNNTVCKYAFRKNIKLLISPHGTLDSWSLKYKKLKKNIAWNIYQKNNLNKANVLHACSYKEAENLLNKNLKIPIAIIPNGTSLPTYDQLKKDFSLIDLGIKNNNYKNLLYIGRLHPVKGLKNLIYAFKKISIGTNCWRLIIAGYSELNYDNQLKKIICENNLEERILILDPVSGDDLVNLYRNSTFFVLPSFSENFGMVVTEALSFGLPVITTTGTPWSILKEKNCGWTVEPSINEIYEAISEAINISKKEYSEKSLNARNLSKEYSWANISKSFISLYLWMLGDSSKPKFII